MVSKLPLIKFSSLLSLFAFFSGCYVYDDNFHSHIALLPWETNTANRNKIEKNKILHVYPEYYGAVGDGIRDDTQALQSALAFCSNSNMTCRLKNGAVYKVTKPLFLWGGAQLIGSDRMSTILFQSVKEPYLFNLGISNKNILETPFSGKIKDVRFKVEGGKGGRILFFWRTNGAKIKDNYFDIQSYRYSATSSGNDDRWVKNGFWNCIRKNIEITGNIIRALSDNGGSEGIGLGQFDGALIEGNEVYGVGDDPVGIHYSKNIIIRNNDLASIDGRIYIGSSQNIIVTGNTVKRIKSIKEGRFYAGISLIYLGFETSRSNNSPAPTNITVENNTLVYDEGSVDEGAAIYLYGPRNVYVKNNTIINYSKFVKASAIHILPYKFEGTWKDPGKLEYDNVASVWGVRIIGNVSEGRFPIKSTKTTGNCVHYKGPILFINNGTGTPDYYCKNIRSINSY